MTDQPAMTSESEIAEIERLASEASPGEWIKGIWGGWCHKKHALGYHPGPPDCKYDYVLRNDAPCVSLDGHRELIGYGESGPILCEADANFIAASRTAVPRLCATIRALQAELAATRAEIERLKKDVEEHLTIQCDIQECLNAYKAERDTLAAELASALDGAASLAQAEIEWVCEQHPDKFFPHDDCTGPLMPAMSAIEKLQAELAAAKRADQNQVDYAVQYRNLAIKYGAKPDEMLHPYDRKLCESGNSMDEGIQLLGDVWDENERLQAELAAARAELAGKP